MSKKDVQTIADIARLAGVSKATVSRALNDSPLIADETKERIQSIARTHNFQIHVSAQRLSKRESRTIAFMMHPCCPDFSMTDQFTLEVMGAVSAGLSQNNYDMLMAHVDPTDKKWVRQYLDTGRVDGFILMVSTHKQHHIKTLLEMGAPFIVLGIPQPQQNYCSVVSDNINGGRLAVEHLLHSGRRKIAFLGGPEYEVEVHHRYEGYETALKTAGYTIDPALVAYADFTAPVAAREMRKLLDQSPGLDAIFVNSDVMAIAVIDVLRAAGRRVPDDVAVVGYDNLSIAAISRPPLTTVSQNLPLIGRLLAENLIQYLRKGIVTNVSVPVELVVRESA